MKNKSYSYIGISFIVLVFGIIVIPKIVDRFKDNKVIQNDRLNVNVNISGKKSNLFVMGEAPKFKLTNQDGKIITNDFYKGKVYVVEFFFSTCPSICPVMNQNMLDVEKTFLANKNFGIVSITINPEFDTSEVLKAYANMLGVKSENWSFLTGDKNYIFDVANKGFKVFAQKNDKVAGGFEHQGLFALVDKNGKLRCRLDSNGNPIGYYSGLNYSDSAGHNEDFEGKFRPDIDAIKEDIKKLLEE